MQFSVVALFIGAAIAIPATPATLKTMTAKLASRDGGVCGDLLYGTPVCCTVDVLGLADLNCDTPSSANDSADFKKSCTDASASAHCCTLNLLDGVGLVCKDAI
ncbi:hypothetical protein NLG97_g8231 [Lecanicillium saksenae]|uniref:Uncharacterized protein n=1 Tax=Lecanicillium saksenae TaxID=468837 RepID=A0ACC1QKV3_9HYPO|nr:hypothetical protein NLG97_g8231 [Lecanicillium saksenae]